MSPTDQPQDALPYLRGLFRFFARTQLRGRSPLYACLSEAAAGDDALLAPLLHAPPGQRRPSLLLASVNHLLRDRRDHPLAGYYPVHGGDRPVDGGAPAAFADFCAEHARELRHLLAHRTTQTNEIRRCFALRLGVQRVARHWPGPLALLEIGSSAGLNLHFDAYGYRAGGLRTQPRNGSGVVVATTVRGGGAPQDLLGPLPVVGHRLGADLRPVDLAADPAAGAWLEAFVWPEQVGELATLRAAVELARRSPYPLVRADAVRDTARLVAEVPGRQPVVVFTASLLSYLDARERSAFVAQLDTAAAGRPVAWVFAEAPGLLGGSGLAAPALSGPLRGSGENYAVGVSLRGARRRRDEVLALADPYVEWIAPARHPGDDLSWAARAEAGAEEGAGRAPRRAPDAQR